MFGLQIQFTYLSAVYEIVNPILKSTCLNRPIATWKCYTYKCYLLKVTINCRQLLFIYP